MNMRSAYLHLLTDMMASVAVLIGGLLMKFYEIFWIDSLLTLVIALYLIWVGFDLFKESFKVLMLFTPNELHIQDIVKELNVVKEIKNIHHIHVWQLNEEETHFEAHVDFNYDIKLSDFDDVLKRIEKILLEKFQINHINIQPEYGKCDSKEIIVQD